MIVLGISGAVSHDPSAALFIDGELVAAAEEERFIRDKHAKGRFPYEATKFCLEFAGISPEDVDVVSFPYAEIPLTSPARWHYALRHWYSPDRTLLGIFNGNRRFRRNMRNLNKLISDLNIGGGKARVIPVEHHLAHASSAYHMSGYDGKVAILGIDGKGEYATTFFGYGENGKIHKIKEFYDPDSLGGMYGAMTEFLGFEMLDGEFKVMGMAPYGDPKRFDFSRLIDYDQKSFRVNTRLVNVIGPRRYKDKDGKGYYFSPKLIEWLGPKREGDEIDDPYIDYAASIQQLLEDVSLGLIEHYLAASYVANELGDRIQPMQHVYLGPSYTSDQCIAACELHERNPKWGRIDNVAQRAAKILAEGNPLSWFQGRMEFGPRALGNRSILGAPNVPGIAERINEQIKYRERWRPFCPSMLDRVAPEMLQTEHPSPYMTFTFDVAEEWKERVPEVVHEDGTSRAQIVTKEVNPLYYELIEELEKLTGNGVILNTSLNRRGEPMVCSPMDALNMFYGSDLEYLIMEDILVVK
ncbi:MAG: carbamoyltransferase C-terminal domain-containing protein [Gammaproteobacteria bacterium]